MSNEDRKRLREIVDNLARERGRARRREIQAAYRRRNGSREIPQTAKRMPEDTVQDYVQHALPYWLERERKLSCVKLIVSHAPRKMRPAIVRELMAMVKSA